MSIKKHINGYQHVGVPTLEMDKTLAFYESLGFDVSYETIDGGDRVCFLSLQNVTIEIYEVKEVSGKAGAIDHLALDVDDIVAIYKEVIALGYRVLEGSIQTLPFWANGVRYFTITGPNGENIEFSQIL